MGDGNPNGSKTKKKPDPDQNKEDQQDQGDDEGTENDSPATKREKAFRDMIAKKRGK